MSFSSKIVHRGLQGLYLEALRSLAVCKLCTSVLHNSPWSQSEGFKRDLAFRMICRSVGASQGLGESPGWFSHHRIKSVCMSWLLRPFSSWLLDWSMSSPRHWWVASQTRLLYRGVLRFFQTKRFITLKNTIRSIVTPSPSHWFIHR